MIEQAREKKDTWIAGGKVLLVDDDIRNLFALTSVLERHKLQVLHAESGQEAIEMLKQEQGGVDLVLMDIMMPRMDGYETIRSIRKDPQFAHLSIVALTAKAMKGDREKCIEAGASDYITKPVNLDDLIWLMRAWLPRASEGA
jgi:CheY-like chemotaxis protein